MFWSFLLGYYVNIFLHEELPGCPEVLNSRKQDWGLENLFIDIPLLLVLPITAASGRLSRCRHKGGKQIRQPRQVSASPEHAGNKRQGGAAVETAPGNADKASNLHTTQQSLCLDWRQ